MPPAAHGSKAEIKRKSRGTGERREAGIIAIRTLHSNAEANVYVI